MVVESNVIEISNNDRLENIKEFSKNVRIQILEQLVARGFGHLGGSMSIADVIAVLYENEMKYDPKNPKWDERDWLTCSKGHAGPAVYAALALKGFFPMEWMQTLNQPGTNLPSHSDMHKTPGIDLTTGSLGQGLSVTVGAALAHYNDEKDNKFYCIVGDGELQEGQNWEAIMFAAHQDLDNLILFVDNNKVQLDGATEDVNNVEDLAAKFNGFNWHTQRIDGHDHGEICDAIKNAHETEDMPSVIILETVKGKGVYWAEDAFNHHVEVSREMADLAIEKIKEM